MNLSFSTSRKIRFHRKINDTYLLRSAASVSQPLTKSANKDFYTMDIFYFQVRSKICQLRWQASTQWMHFNNLVLQNCHKNSCILNSVSLYYLYCCSLQNFPKRCPFGRIGKAVKIRCSPATVKGYESQIRHCFQFENGKA
jgi:hypothetical protein